MCVYLLNVYTLRGIRSNVGVMFIAKQSCGGSVWQLHQRQALIPEAQVMAIAERVEKRTAGPDLGHVVLEG